MKMIFLIFYCFRNCYKEMRYLYDNIFLNIIFGANYDIWKKRLLLIIIKEPFFNNHNNLSCSWITKDIVFI